MADFLERLKTILFYMRLEDKYWGVFFASLFVLFFLRDKETKGLRSLALGSSLICPLTAYGLICLFPSLEGYYKLWHMVPVAGVICTACIRSLEMIGKDRKKQVLFAAGIFVLLFFAGEFAYTSKDAWNGDRTFLGSDEVTAYEMILSDMDKKGKQEAHLWGPYKLMADSRVYHAAFQPVYGKDILHKTESYDETLVSMYQGYEKLFWPDQTAGQRLEQIEAVANFPNAFPDVRVDYVVIEKKAAEGSGADLPNLFESLGYETTGETDFCWVFFRKS